MTGVKTYRVEGMTCEGCARAVTAAVRKLAPDAFLEIDVNGGLVRVGGDTGEETVRRAVERAGFTWRGAAAAAE